MYILRANNGVLLQEKRGKNIVYHCKNTKTGEEGYVNNTWVRNNIKDIENAVIENGKVVFGVKEKNNNVVKGFYDLLGKMVLNYSFEGGYLELNTSMGDANDTEMYIGLNVKNKKDIKKVVAELYDYICSFDGDEEILNAARGTKGVDAEAVEYWLERYNNIHIIFDGDDDIPEDVKEIKDFIDYWSGYITTYIESWRVNYRTLNNYLKENSIRV